MMCDDTMRTVLRTHTKRSSTMIMMRPIALLLFLFWIGTCHGALGFGKKPADGKKPSPSSLMHDDASTGTVTQLTADQEDSMTCDGIMAKSLVKANEAKALAEEERDSMAQEKKKALERVAQLQEGLAAARTSFDAQLKALEEEYANVDETIKDIKAEAEAAVKVAEDEVKRVKAEAEEHMKKVTEEHQKALDAMLAENEQQIEEIYAETDANTEQILNETHHKIKQYEKTIKEVKEKAKKDVDDVRNETQTALAENQKSWEAKNTSLKKESEERIKQCTEESNAVAAAAEKDRNSIKILMEELGVKTAHELEVAVEEAKGVLAEKERTFQKKHEEKEAELVVTQKKSKEQEETLNSEISDLKKQLKEVEEDLNERRKELANWEELHSKRSYCNLTHVGEDTMSAVSRAGRRVADQASVAKEKSFRVARQVAEQASVAAAPGLKKSRELYDQHLKQHVDQRVMPVHEKHVAPVLGVIGRFWRKASGLVRGAAHSVYFFLLVQFQRTCPKILSGIQGLDNAMDMAVPTMLVEHVEESCANPERSVNSFLRAALLLIAIIYRKILWRTGKKMVMVPIRLIWTFTPLRLFIRNRFGAAHGNGTSDGVKREQNEVVQSK